MATHSYEVSYFFTFRLDGILAGFGQLYLKTPEGFVANEEASIHVDVVADLWLFRPKVGAVLKAVVNPHPGRRCAQQVVMFSKEAPYFAAIGFCRPTIGTWHPKCFQRNAL